MINKHSIYNFTSKEIYKDNLKLKVMNFFGVYNIGFRFLNKKKNIFRIYAMPKNIFDIPKQNF